MLTTGQHVECILTRVQDSDHTDLLEQTGNVADHQHYLPQCAMETLCPIPMSDSMIEPGIFGFGTIVEANIIAAALQPDS